MTSATTALLRELLDVAQCDVETLELHKLAAPPDAPSQEVIATIERVQALLRATITGVRAEVDA